MEKIDNGDLLIEVKERIADILNKNDIAISELSIKKTRDTFENHIIPKLISQPTPTLNEVKLDSSKTIRLKTNAKGVIEFANDYSREICGYEEFELIGQIYNITSHPDMPKFIFDIVRNRLNKGGNIHALVKNLAKDGSYYWTLSYFDAKFNENGKLVSLYVRKKAASKNTIFRIEKIYKKAIEDRRGIIIADKYFSSFLEDKNTTYDKFILEISGFNNESILDYFKNENLHSLSKKRKNVLSSFFQK